MKLIDAIKLVEESFENFTDNQIHKFNVHASEEIEKRKKLNNYSPQMLTRTDNAGKVEKKKEVKT